MGSYLVGGERIQWGRFEGLQRKPGSLPVGLCLAGSYPGMVRQVGSWLVGVVPARVVPSVVVLRDGKGSRGRCQ